MQLNEALKCKYFKLYQKGLSEVLLGKSFCTPHPKIQPTLLYKYPIVFLPQKTIIHSNSSPLAKAFSTKPILGRVLPFYYSNTIIILSTTHPLPTPSLLHTIATNPYTYYYPQAPRQLPTQEAKLIFSIYFINFTSLLPFSSYFCIYYKNHPYSFSPLLLSKYYCTYNTHIYIGTYISTYIYIHTHRHIHINIFIYTLYIYIFMIGH